MSFEPTDVGPLYGGDQRITDADRQLVVTLLTAAWHDKRLTEQDYRTRMAAVNNATVFDDLTPLTRDLMEGAPPATSTGFTRPGGLSDAAAFTGDPAPAPIIATASSPGRTNLLGIFGSTTRKGVWRASDGISAVALFGAVEFDLTQAVWTSPVIEVFASCAFGAIEIIVPPGTEVESSVMPLFGGVEVRGTTADVSQRKLIVRGFCCFGGITVRGPKKSKMG
ncbi:MAG: DUF1707 domain-containing protein [Propionibacteriaceae bacterium]|jgi:hypothetical protein|nr:DUF1707 domain-containing protein [Propionibacteriaceae bacterium]